MKNIYYRGENILVRWSLWDKDKAPVPFSSVAALSITLRDQQGNTKVYTKIGNTVTQFAGAASNEFQFEILSADTTAFGAGKLVARFTYSIDSAEHNGQILIDIIEEGVISEFIVLQD